MFKNGQTYKYCIYGVFVFIIDIEHNSLLVNNAEWNNKQHFSRLPPHFIC